MKFDLNKSSEGKPARKFDLSKQSDPKFTTVDTKESSPVKMETSKNKKNRFLVFSLLVIICAAGVIWFMSNSDQKSGQKVGVEQNSSVNQVAPNAAPVNASDNSKTEEANLATNNPRANAVSEQPLTAEVKSVQTEEQHASNPSIPNENIPYKRNESYKVYQFPFGDSTFSQANPELDKLVEVLKKNPELRISISAYTDDIGDAGYNLSLSELRAKAIHDYLVDKGINAGRMKFQGKGISTKYETKAENRRAEFVIG